MPVLNDPQKTEIVRLLAAFHTPTGVAVKLQEDTGLCVDRAQVIRYDPTKPCFEGGDKWRAIFWEARKRYLQEIVSIPIAHSGFRLNRLQSIFHEAERSGNYRLALQALDQAAREAQGLQDTRSNGVIQPPLETGEARQVLKQRLEQMFELARNEGREEGRQQMLDDLQTSQTAGAAPVNGEAAGQIEDDVPHPTNTSTSQHQRNHKVEM